MKPLPFLALMALALPVSAMANVAMEAQQSGRSNEVASPPAHASAHRQMFIVKYELRRPSPETPRIVMDDTSAQIVPPDKELPFWMLGATHRDPNTEVCSGWGCQRKP